MPGPVALDERNFDYFLATHDGILVVDFWARWCRPCKAMAPLVARVAAERPELLVAKVDVDRARRLAARHGVSAVPTLMRFDDGRPTASVVGALPYDRLLAELGLDGGSDPVRLGPRAA
jgi:thioredoxin